MPKHSKGGVYRHLDVVRRGASKKLVVIVHGYSGCPNSLGQVLRTLEEERAFADADLLVPEYRAGLASNSDVYLVASHLEGYIDHLNRQRVRNQGGPYEQITLIGHSLGALLIRKCYAWGHGSTEDHPARPPKGVRHDWVLQVDRLILLAGVNRGWSLEGRPKHMSRSQHLFTVLVWRLGIVLGQGKLVRAVERGAPFVADLRVQWIRLASRLGSAMAPTVQLLGDVDDVVSRDDSHDALVAKNFIAIPLLGTGHMNITNFSEPVYGSNRRDKFREALLTPIDQLVHQYRQSSENCVASQEGRNPSGDHVIFLMHGIRDLGHWRQSLQRRIEALDPRAVVVTSSYGWFPMARFLIGWDRQRNVRWFMDRYTEQLAWHPQASISFFGHSNGTYLLASAMQRYQSVQFERVAFAGSVVPRAFPWSNFGPGGSNRIRVLRNDMGTKDWVVAIFPRLFELIHELFARGPVHATDIGSGGFNGFEDDFADNLQVYLDGGHGAGILEANHDSLARFLIHGENTHQQTTFDHPSNLVSVASRLCWLCWTILATCLATVCYTTGMLGGTWGLLSSVLIVLAILFTL